MDEPKYVVVEMQTGQDGKVACLVTSYDDRLQAESAWHSVMAAAAIGTLPVHAAVLLDNLGAELLTARYEHGAAGE